MKGKVKVIEYGFCKKKNGEIDMDKTAKLIAKKVIKVVEGKASCQKKGKESELF